MSYALGVVRWFLPWLLALATLGSSAATWAAAGMVGHCCCPDARICKCHDRSPRHVAEIKSCSSSPEHVVAPVIAAAIAPSRAIVETARAVQSIEAPSPLALRARHLPPPELPPF